MKRTIARVGERSLRTLAIYADFLTNRRMTSTPDRVLTTLLFTDLVGSTERAATLGDEAWRARLDRHDDLVASQLRRFRGRRVKHLGDGVLATFDSPGRANRCALALREGIRALELDVRAGLHTGETEIRGNDVAGIAVHVAARVAATADAGEVLVSASIPDLVAGSDIAFIDRAEHRLKGLNGTWRLFAVDG